VVDVHFSTDVTKAEAAIGPWLRRDSVTNNVALTLLDRLSDQPGQARFWWATKNNYISGVCLQGDPRQSLYVRTDDLNTIPAFVEAVVVSRDAPPLPGVNGHVLAAGAWGATWADVSRRPITIAAFQRYYHLPGRRSLRPLPPPTGALRAATHDDLGLLTRWAIGFQRDVHPGVSTPDRLNSPSSNLTPGPMPDPAPARSRALDPKPDPASGHKHGQDPEPDATAEPSRYPTPDIVALRSDFAVKLERNELWIWDDDGPRAVAGATRPVDGVSRIHFVYTPPEYRNRGLAAACTAGAVERATDVGAETCVLFADLANPTSNAIYRRLGFQPHSEHLNIAFAHS